MNMQNHIWGLTNNPDIYFDYLYNRGQNSIQNIKISYPVIFFIYYGRLIIKCKNKKILIQKGEYVFVQASTIVTFHIENSNDKSFYGIYISFNESFLYKFYINYYNKKFLPENNKNLIDIIKMPCTPYMQSLYISMMPYWESKTKPEKNIMELKRLECIYCMLKSDSRFHNFLFNFMKPIELNLIYMINKNNLN